MARAIDKDYLLKHKRKVRFFGIGSDDESWGYAVPAEIIENAPTLTPPNEPLTLDKKRVIAESCLHYGKSGHCGLNGYAPLDCPKCKEWQSNESNI